MPATEVTKLVSISPLPEYSPSSPAPEYSDELLLGEERLEHTPRPDRLRPTPTGVFVKKAGRTSIVLNEQEDGVRIPSYGRHAVVSGAVCLENPSIVEEVTVKLDGRMDLTISEGGSKSHKLVNETYTLWSKKDATAEQPMCPCFVPFSLLIPSTYEEGDKTRPLPPSFDTAFPGVPGLFAKCTYTLVVTIAKIRHRQMTWLTKNKTISIRLHYHPRTRPHRPNVSSSCLFSSLKVAPEEWQQVIAQMQPRYSSSLTPIDCHLMVPAAQIFGLEEAIPFHIQLTGTIASLRAFLPQSTEVYPLSPIDTTSTVDTSATLVHSPLSLSSLPPTAVSVCPSSSSPKPLKRRFSRSSYSPPSTKPIIRVFLLRQISVQVRGQKAWRNCTLGEGKIWPLPPPAGSMDCLVPEREEANLDWEGEVRCNSNTMVGGFNAGQLAVKDFIVLALTPPDPHSSPLLEFQYAHPIRFVTDPWTDLTGHELDQFTSR
ncbi:hypothetical protein BDN71DRAFT_1509816 [Pleurotus eryngii]|uniref:Uncharacterized protein n=1 Tax=Pleurotus eryngii TaxID=5323 RepID=A0A9P5ZPU4_PLEER|nr:hypothetical protein BDN71DRAFT_1509816 [Pleurotus eryngii]